MYQWIKDPIRGWCFVPEWMADMCRAEKGFGIDHEADRRAFSRIHSAAPPSARVTVVGAPKVVTAEELMAKPKPGGWSEPLPLKPPPGTELVDRLVDAQDRKDRAEAGLRRKLK
jgi:hypothetical protein